MSGSDEPKSECITLLHIIGTRVLISEKIICFNSFNINIDLCREVTINCHQFQEAISTMSL